MATNWGTIGKAAALALNPVAAVTHGIGTIDALGALDDRLRQAHRSSDAMRQSAASGYDRRGDLRQQGIAAAQRKMDYADQAVRDHAEQARRNLEQIRYRGGQAIALNAPRMGPGGGLAAATSDVAQEAAMNMIAQESQDQAMARQLRAQAADERLAGIEYITKAGSEAEDYTAAMAEATVAINDAIDKRWGYANERSAIQAIIAKVRESSPRAADDLEKKYFGAA